ncbi:MAG: hypothetical protein C0601_10120 [Candidatus Muiribacterium halophilum]|uniref:Lnb N-terminal periplasmic domain-containing protein n=1 Tax=Muiribacterium halophilum TaxID=2053465 RepID=A0A2N5ZCR2_MUIH1|nr:MAG: hypothetical protein C0601_10120 [Candidatus Muirbacterium halophilum]
MYKKTVFLLILLLTITSIYSLAPLRPDQRQIDLTIKDNGNMVVKNFRFGFPDGTFDSAEFRTATIDPNKIKDVYYWSKDFPPKYIGAHGMLMFLMKDFNGIVTDRGEKEIGLVMSVEAWLRTDQEYSIIKGVKPGNYPIIYTVTGYTDGIQRAINVGGLTIGQYKLKLNDDQKKDLLIRTLKKAASVRDESYNTVVNSCVSTVFDLINEVVPKKKRLKKWIIPYVLLNPRVILPRLAPGYLQSKGLAGKKDALYDMNSTIVLDTEDGPFKIVVADLPTRPTKRSDFDFTQFDNTIANYLTTITMMREMGKNSENITANVLFNQFSYETDVMLDDIQKMVKENPSRYIEHYFSNKLNEIEGTEDITLIINEAKKQ